MKYEKQPLMTPATARAVINIWFIVTVILIGVTILQTKTIKRQNTNQSALLQQLEQVEAENNALLQELEYKDEIIEQYEYEKRRAILCTLEALECNDD